MIEPIEEIPLLNCEVCNRNPESEPEAGGCICPECRVCGVVGDPKCWREHFPAAPQAQEAPAGEGEPLPAPAMPSPDLLNYMWKIPAEAFQPPAPASQAGRPNKVGFFWWREKPGAPWEPARTWVDYDGTLTFFTTADSQSNKPLDHGEWGPEIPPAAPEAGAPGTQGAT